MSNRPDGGEMDRREAIKRVTALLGGAAFVGGSTLLAACAKERAPAPSRDGAIGTFSAAEVAYLDEIADTILPETSTPGAKAAKVGAFIAVMVTDCYEQKDQAIFATTFSALDEACFAMHKVPFMNATPAQRLSLLESVDREAKTHMDNRKPDEPPHFFRMVKELTLLGYFTSEIGYTQAMRYRETPGRFDPCVPYAKGEVLWASHA